MSALEPITACLFFCHGARAPAWRVPFDAIVARFREHAPGVLVRLGFLELMAPGFDEAVTDLLAAGAQRIHVVPLFLAPGNHTQRDLPALVTQARERWPTVQFSIAPTLTEDPSVREAILMSAMGALQSDRAGNQP